MKRSAFTLIELLIVVAIIAILAAIAVPNFLEAQVRSKVSRVKTDMRSLATAIEAYRLDHNVYPPNSTTTAAFTAAGSFSAENPASTTVCGTVETDLDQFADCLPRGIAAGDFVIVLDREPDESSIIALTEVRRREI